MRNKSIAAIVIALAASVALAKDDAAKTGYGGIVIRVEGKTLIISQGLTEAVVGAEDGTRITLDGKPAELATLKRGMGVRIQLDEGLPTLIEARRDGEIPAQPGDKTDAPPPDPTPAQPTVPDQPQPPQPANNHRVEELNQPDGEYPAGALNSDDTLTLSGKVKSLKVDAVAGAAKLDASGLQAKEVILSGAFGGSGSAVINAPGGTVIVQGTLGGGSNLTITAPGGKVVFENATGGIGEGARVHVTAGEVDIRSEVGGGASIEITLTKGGALKTAAISAGGHIVYRKEKPDDPELKVETGTITAGGSCRQGE